MTKSNDTAETTAVSVFEVANPLLVLTDAEKFDRFYEDVKRETDTLEIDLTTETGRKRIASMAYKVARTKTAIDEAGKTLTEEWRGKIKVVDDSRRAIREKLDALKDEVRAPLTKWEADEVERLRVVDEFVAALRDYAVVLADDTAEDVSNKLGWVRAQDLPAAVLQGHHQIATNLKAQAIVVLEAAHIRLVNEEADRRELERLRAAEVARGIAEAMAIEEENRRREEQEAIERQRAEIEATRVAEAEKAERLEAQAQVAIKAAEEAARAEEQRLATEAQATRDKAATDALAEQQRAHAEALAEAKRRADEAEQARVAEARKYEAEAARLAEQAAREKAEQAARDKDRKHRGEVMSAAKVAMMELGADEEVARKIVLAIVANEISAVSLRF